MKTTALQTTALLAAACALGDLGPVFPTGWAAPDPKCACAVPTKTSRRGRCASCGREKHDLR